MDETPQRCKIPSDYSMAKYELDSLQGKWIIPAEFLPQIQETLSTEMISAHV
jgi:hypothetical protein